MTSIIEKLRFLRIYGSRQAWTRGESPDIQLSNTSFDWKRGLRLFIGSTLVFFVIAAIFFAWFKHFGFVAATGEGLHIALILGFYVTIIYYLFPILKMFAFMIWHRRRPPRSLLSQFSLDQKIASLLLISYWIFYLFNHLYPSVQWSLQHDRLPIHIFSSHPFVSIGWHIAVIVIVLAGLLGVIFPRLLPITSNASLTSTKPKKGNRKEKNEPIFGLWVGRSTGHLARLWHGTGMSANIEVTLELKDAAQNILVLGGIGAGKTTRLMQPLLVQLLDQSCGGLLFDVKGDVKQAVIKLDEMTDKSVTLIGPNHTHLNLLAGLTPEVAASFLKSAFLLSGGSKMDGFWVDTATELCRNTLGVLSFLPEHYTLQGLYGYLFEEDFKEAIQESINGLLVTLAAKEQRLLKTYLCYHDAIFGTFDEKVKSGVNATVAQALSPFNHPELIDAFCQYSGNEADSLRMEAVLNGTVYLVDMPLSRWGLGGKVAYTFIKLRFFNVMQSRIHHPEWNQDKPVFFMCDEYQELISASKDGLSDLSFWDKSRSSKTIGIISAQSVSSFYAALGDHDLTHAILQNFRQKLCFRTEDPATLNMMDKLAGQARVQKTTISQTSGSGSSSNHKSLFDSTSKSLSNTQSITETRESVLDAVLFRHLSPDQAVALLSLNGHSMDDVLELLPVFL